MPADLRASAPPAGPVAYVTLVTNGDYARGAVALLRSIARTGTTADRVVMHTPAVPGATLERLAGCGARLIETGLLETSEAFNAVHAKGALHGAAPFERGAKPPFHTPLDNFVKLRVWQLEEYRRVVFVDADALVLQNCDRLFAYPEFSAAPNVYESLADFHRLNSGVFVAAPSAATFARMMGALDRPGAFWRRTDQTFLQGFFPDWHGLPVFFNMLQYVWLNMPALWHWPSIRILHYQYEKPWQSPHPRLAALGPLVELWEAHEAGRPVPDLADLPPPPSCASA